MMNGMLSASAGLALAAAVLGVATPAVAGRMYSLDPRIGGPAAPVSSGAPAVAPVSVPKGFFDRDLLLTSTIIATSSPKVLVGVSQIPVLVRPKVGTAVELVRVRGPLGGDETLAGHAIATWPAHIEGEEVSVTPETPLDALTLNGTSYHAATPTGAQDPEVTADRVAVTLHYTAQAEGKPNAGDPASVDLSVRLTLFYRPAPTLAPRSYSQDDFHTAGLFTLATYESGFSGAPGDIAIRPDPAQKLRFVLHPSVPEATRELITRSVLSWNPVLERAIGAPVITVENGTDATLMPGTPGVVVVYWFPHDIVQSFMGYTQALADPRNGEIIGGQILLSEQQLLGDGAIQALVDEAIVSAGRGPKAPVSDPRARVLASQVFQPEPTAGGSPDDVLTWTMVHETGHLLGLRHNFKGSFDVQHYPAGEHSTSCMDYLPTPLAPRHPLNYDEFALAFGQGKVAPGGPFLFASDEGLTGDPDCNQYDCGDPLEWARSYGKTLRSTRNTLPEAGAPEISAGLLYTALAGAVKMAVKPADPRHAKALRYLLELLADQGADPAIGGGLAGKTTGDTPAELARAKNLPDRRAATSRLMELAGSGQLPMQERDLFLRSLARTAFDAPRTDLFEARRFALSSLSKVGGADARLALWTMLSTLQRQLVSGKRTPTFDQDRKLFDKGRTFLGETARSQ